MLGHEAVASRTHELYRSQCRGPDREQGVSNVKRGNIKVIALQEQYHFM